MPEQMSALAWNRLPLWLKILLIPVLFSAIIWITAITVATLATVIGGITVSINKIANKFRQSDIETATA